MSAATISIEGAAQVFRPPSAGLPFLRHDRAEEISLEGGDVAVADGIIAGLEPAAESALRIDARGCALIPGLVDCHTHLPFAGWRAEEYASKVAGASYEEVAEAGGGIRSSARMLSESGDAEVLAQARGLAAEMLAHGTTTFECKSGYGLSPEAELRSLRLARELGAGVTQETTTTALIAHAVPEGWDADGWLARIAAELPAIVDAHLASALDVYVESVAFTNRHLKEVGRLAAQNRLALRAHVEQFATHRSVPVALAAGARSVDHLACLHPDDLEPLAAADCAAVLLPGAELLGDERVAPGRALADAGAICALATDANPGTSPIVSLPLVIGLAVRRYGWSAREALLATTLNAAWVLERSRELGSIEAGKRADLVLLDGPVEHVAYRFGHNPVLAVIAGGELVHLRPDARERLAGPLAAQWGASR